MHIKMLELAKDHLNKQGVEVISGIISPVHEKYEKKDLEQSFHRVAMVKLAIQTSSWIRLSTWETEQKEWTTTRHTLEHHQNCINSIQRNSKGLASEDLLPWIPQKIYHFNEPIKIRLLFGADILESFEKSGKWDKEDLEMILGQHGIVVITRSGTDLEKVINESNLLSKFRQNITIVTNSFGEKISSTEVRERIKQNLSVKDFLDEKVIEYIKHHRLYGYSPFAFWRWL